MKDYAVMTGLGVLFVIGIVLFILCLKKYRKKTTKIVSSILCVVLSISSLVGLVEFKARDENRQTGNSSVVDTNKEVNIGDINLTIDNKEETVTDFNQVLSGTFSLSSTVTSIKYIIATEIDDYEVTSSGNANINGNTYSSDIQLKPETNKITVTATTENGKTESKSVKIIYDSGKVYELDENHVAYDNETNTQYVNNIVLIYFLEGISEDRRNEIVSSINGKVVGSINGVNQWQVEINPTNLKGLKEICANLEKEDGVSAAFVDTISKVSIDISTNDPYKNAKGGNWYLDAIEAYSAWDYNERFNYIDIGVVDNGFDVGHEDLKGVINFPNESLKQNNKKAEHGTHVAGIIGANANNKKGMAGLVWKSKLWCVDWEPEGTQEWNTQNEILLGLIYTVEAGAKIINFSIGMAGSLNYDEISKVSNDDMAAKQTAEVMVQLLGQNKDFVVVQSAGNGTKDGYAVEAKYSGLFSSITNNDIDVSKNPNLSKQDILDRIIIVGNAQRNDDGNYQQAVDSNGGTQVDICAPGTNIYSTVPGKRYNGLGGWINGSYSNLSGTSMAAPMVTAVCGLVWSINSNFTGAEVKDIVCNSYDKNIWVWDNPDGKHTTNDKYRMLNAKLSVEEAIRRTDKTAYSWLVKPTLEADDIIVFDKSYVPDVSPSIYDWNTNKSEQGAPHSKYAIIKKNNDYGFIDYDGQLISKDFYQNFNGCHCGEVAIQDNNIGTESKRINVSEEMNIIYGQVGHGMGASVVYYAENYEKFYTAFIGGPIDGTKVGEHPFAFRQLSTDEDNNSNCSIGTARLIKISDLDTDNAEITEINNKYALFNKGKLTSDFIFEKAYSDCYGQSNIAACKKDGKWGYYSYDGKEIIPCQFDDVQNRINNDAIYNAYLPTYGYIAVNKDGGYGYYDIDGNEVIPCGEFEQARPVYDGKAWVKKDGKWGVISINDDKNDINETTKNTNTIETNDSKADYNIPAYAKTYNGHSYYIYSNVCDTWEEAKMYCESLGGYLAVINDESENKAVFNIMKESGYDNAYFGYTDSKNEGNWKWINNVDSNYENWSDGEPNNEGGDENYAMFYYKSPEYQWNDGDFSGGTVNGENQFICEWDS